MKNVKKIVLGVVSLTFAACGLSDQEIENALRDADDSPAGHLDYRVGLKWTESTRRTDTHLLLKYENGAYTYCDLGDLMTGSDCPTPVEGEATVAETETVHHVVGKVDAASLALPGYAVRTTTTTRERLEGYDPETDTFSEDGEEVENRATDLFTLGEHNGFVVWLDGVDNDVSRGKTLFPSNPRVDGVYVDDMGGSWRVNEVATVDIGELTGLTAHRIHKATRRTMEQPDRDWLVRNCVLKVPISDTEFEIVTLKGNGDPCKGPWLLEETIELSLYHDVPVTYARKQRWLTLISAKARSDDTFLVDYYEKARGDDALVFRFDERTIIETGEVTSLTW